MGRQSKKRNHYSLLRKNQASQEKPGGKPAEVHYGVQRWQSGFTWSLFYKPGSLSDFGPDLCILSALSFCFWVVSAQARLTVRQLSKCWGTNLIFPEQWHSLPNNINKWPIVTQPVFHASLTSTPVCTRLGLGVRET